MDLVWHNPGPTSDRRCGTRFVRMIVPFSVNDFLDRATAVYADRIGIADEPDQPAASLGDLTYGRVGELARGDGRPARPARARRRRPGRVRLAQQRAALHGVLRRLRLRPGAGAGELPALLRRGAVHRRALRLAGGLRRPGAEGRAGRARGRARVRARRRRRPLPRGRRAAGRGSRTRTRPRRSTTPPARPRAPRACRSRTATSGPTPSPSRCTPGSPTATSTCTRCRCSTPTAGACRSR